ncbi:Rne/Rng family ribonuclease [Klenkia brasiliensis]|uniref:Ribonuclease E n=1 Tax=Klenkia brasiliensis TaxID=333142 RepID=A0A1G7UJ27_9ACTN|nr:Rne/Rng family ribonuclease [Klenkia brasiliensis]SDG47562.1 ribonuclease E [Klenkia brasiliensis]
MADTDDTSSGTTDQQVAEPQDTTPPDIPAGEPAPDEETVEEPADEAAGEPAAEQAPAEEQAPVAELRADAATLEAAAIPPTRALAEDPEAPRFGAQFSSPEPTTVTARPRRRATRPALSADPGSVEPAAAAPPAPAFVSFVAAPQEVAPPAPRRRSRRTQAETPAEPEEPTAPVEAPAEEDAKPRRSRSRRRATEPAAEPAAGDTAEETVVLTAAGEDEDTREAEDDATDGDEDDDRDSGSGSRRRRRGRRGRGRGRSGEDDDEQTGTAEGETAEDDGDDEPGDAEGDEDGADDSADGGRSTTRRRRRRRRRGESAGDAAETPADDDRPERAGRNGKDSSDDAVRGVAGSTRLEAKRQRRRDGRDTGRRRAPILSESEFLARREAVDRAMVIRQQGERTQIAVLEDDVLVEHYVTQAQSTSFAGNVYLGRVQNVLPSMEAAFVDIGKGRNAVLYAGEVNWETAGLSGKSRSIEQALKSGDKVLVQVTKDPIGHKGARLTQQINLPGRFLVYVPGGSMTGISRKLPDTERQRLKDILKKIVPEDAGVIIRTAAEGASEEELTRDVARLQAQWEVIQTKAASTSNAPSLLYGEPDLAIRVIRDVFNEDFKRLVVQGDDAWDTVEAYVAHVSPELSERLERYIGNGDVFRDLRVDEQLLKALDRKVWLPSGGSLVIDRTEAMTVVDVNTGKFTGSGGNLEQTVTRNNIEAAEEIVRQLRLRDIGGMIVIDFIDMVLESNRDLVLRRLTECLGRDRTKHQVAEVTSLGLVQMTRKRVGQGLLEVFSDTCEHCRGRGVVVHLDPTEKRSAGNGGNGNGGNGHGGNGGGNGNGGNGNGGNGNGSNGGRSRGEERAADKPAEAPDDAPATGPDAEGGQEPTGRSGRRNRGRRNRGRNGDEQVAEDAAVLAASRGDDAAPDAVDPEAGVPDTGAAEVAPAAGVPDTGHAEDAAGEKAGVVEPDEVADAVEAAAPADAPAEDAPAGDASAEDAPARDGTRPELPEPADAVTEQSPATSTEGDAAPEPTAVEATTPEPSEQTPAAEPVATEPVAVEPVAAEPVAEAPVSEAPVARPRRRRAASRPAGPPAE